MNPNTLPAQEPNPKTMQNGKPPAIPQPDIRKIAAETPLYQCKAPGCRNKTFTKVTYLKILSRLLTGLPQDQQLEINTWKCTRCGRVQTTPSDPGAMKVEKGGKPEAGNGVAEGEDKQ